MRTLTAFDVDTESLADTFERLAEGMRDGGVMIEEVETGHKAVVEAPTEFELRLQFAANHDFVDVVDAIEYETDTDDPDVGERDFAGRDE